MLTKEQQAELDRRVQKALYLQRTLSSLLDDAERQIKAMREDIAHGSNPRYHGHLLSSVLQANEIAIRILALCE
jgi:hypothetical protein